MNGKLVKLVAPVIAALTLAACNTTGGGSSTVPASLGVSFNWCSGSPTFQLRNVPKDTKTLNFRMMDRQVPGYPHGGGTVSYNGQQSIACGALDGGSYAPPSPPSGSHDYEWTVTAVDAAGRALATGTAVRKFPE